MLKELKGRPQVGKAYHLLRERIAEMHVGVPLPSVPEVMKELSVSQATLTSAYDLLEVEGWIDRCPGKGIFAADGRLSGEMAIVVKTSLLGAEGSPVYRMTSSALAVHLAQKNPRWQVKFHVGRPSETDEAFPATLDLMNPRILAGVRGVFSFQPLFELESALAEAGVPLVRLGGPGGHGSVGLDRVDFLEQSVRYLSEQGCRSLGMIHPFNQGRSSAMRPGVMHADQVVIQAAQKAGVTYRSEWMIACDADVTEAIGYELFQTFWALSDRPDGLIVTDDIVCNGVLRAALQQGVKLSKDIHLVTIANQGIPLAYHEPVARVEFDSDQLVETAVAMMDDLLYDRPLTKRRRLLKGTLVQEGSAPHN